MAESQPPAKSSLGIEVDGGVLAVPPDTLCLGPKPTPDGQEIVLCYGKRGDNDVDFALELAEHVGSGRKVVLTIRPGETASRRYRLMATRNIKLETEDEEAMTDTGEPPRGISFGPDCEVMQHFLVEPAN